MLNLLSIIGVLIFVASAASYGRKIGKIREYVKENCKELYEEKQLDAFSLMLGPPDIAWNAQKFILEKEYLKHDDANLKEMCASAYKCGALSLFGFCLLFVSAIVSGVIGM